MKHAQRVPWRFLARMCSKRRCFPLTSGLCLILAFWALSWVAFNDLNFMRVFRLPAGQGHRSLSCSLQQIIHSSSNMFKTWFLSRLELICSIFVVMNLTGDCRLSKEWSYCATKSMFRHYTVVLRSLCPAINSSFSIWQTLYVAATVSYATRYSFWCCNLAAAEKCVLGQHADSPKPQWALHFYA